MADDRDGAARFAVRLTPRGGGDRVEGVVDGVLRVRVAAPPVEGEANASLIRLLARELDVPRSAVAIVAGAGSRTKTVAVAGLARESIVRRWPGLRG
jgi:uncharacterized protein YggU (UPF0235/DUF167 family)